MRLGFARCVSSSLLLLGTLLNSMALATTTDETAGARAAAQAGLRAYQKANYAEAADLFERAESLMHAPSHVLFLARAYEKVGNLVKARELYIKLAREELPANSPAAFREARETAQQELPAVEARVPYVTVRVTGEGAKEAEVLADGNVVPKALVGIPYPINPGKHQFSARAADRGTASAEIEIAEGGESRVELSLTPGAAASVENAALPDTLSTTGTAPSVDGGTKPARGSWMKPAGWASLGVGVVGAGLGTVMYLRGASKKSDADDAADDCVDGCSDDVWNHMQTLDSDAKSAGVLAVVGFAVGGVGIAGGITLLLLSPSATEHASIRPWATPNAIGVTGRF